MVLNAVDVTNGKLCAGHTLIDRKSTEPKYAPRLLSQFNIHGATVTFDALSTTAQVAQAVLDRGGYYLLAVTDNQPKLFEAVRNLIENSRKKALPTFWGKDSLSAPRQRAETASR